MPYFSFSTRENFNLDNFENFEKNIVYYSKNTKLWKILNSNSYKKFINFCKIEERKKIRAIKFKILFCLPPNIGLGDAIEYGLAIDKLKNLGIFNNIGVAFVGRFSVLFKKYFKCDFLYNDVITERNLNYYDTIFHFTKEIKSLEKQKYLRSNITEEIGKYFNQELLKIKKKYKPKKINTVSLFPISSSPLRTMPVFLINALSIFLKNKINLEIYFDVDSEISDFIEDNIFKSDIKIIKPATLKSLLDYIENIEYGIFMDSGPLHVAKYLNKPGILIETSVSSKVLLEKFANINSIKNIFVSNYCKAPCGLTNIFNFNNKIGCYESIKTEKNKILDLNNFNQLQRGQTKKYYIHYLLNPVGCIRSLDINKIINELNKVIN